MSNKSIALYSPQELFIGSSCSSLIKRAARNKQFLLASPLFLFSTITCTKNIMRSPKSSESWRLCNKAPYEECMCSLRCRNAVQVWTLTLPYAAGVERYEGKIQRACDVPWFLKGQTGSPWNHHLHHTSLQPTTSLSASRCWDAAGKEAQGRNLRCPVKLCLEWS